MLDEVKKQRIIQLVQTSNILNAQEKADWLSLLELMNDKQIGELEEILQPKPIEEVVNKPKPAQVLQTKLQTPESVPVPSKPKIEQPIPSKPQPKAIPQPFIEKPTLNHISNLPNQILDQHTFIPAKPQPLPQQIRPVNKIPVAAKPVPEKTPVRVTPVQHPVAAKPAVKQEEKPPALNFATLEDLAGVTRTVLKQEFRKNFYTSIINLTAQYGYFQVLAILEKSSLYKDYILYGRIKLSSESKQELPLSQEEFEFVTDLLLALKVNRL
jgi:hypothetical protein